jgi:hypothetical protein
MLKPTTTTLGRYGRWLFLVCSAVLLATVCGVYARSVYLYYHHYTSIAAAGGVSLDLLRPVPDANKDTNISHTGDHNAWDPTAPDVEDGVDDGSMLLHPERHVFRDPTTIHMTWNVTLEPRAPDGVMRLVYLINGKWLQHKVAEHESSIRPTSAMPFFQRQTAYQKGRTISRSYN